MNQLAIELNNLRKSYGEVIAVDQVSFSVPKGEIFGLLGPNGAGKTTTLECLEGLRKPDSGMMRIMGEDPARDGRRLRNLIGVQLQTSGLPATMDRMGLLEKKSSQYQELSTGQKRRLALILAIAHDPLIVILDEPTAGLDVASRAELHAMMQELKNNGTTILLATHDMAEAEKMTDSVAILLKGSIITMGTVREITAQGSGFTKISVRTEESKLHEDEIEFPAVSQRVIKDEYVNYFTTEPGVTVSSIINYVEKQGDRLIDLRVERPSLEERFLEITSERN
jgi:ABC-2 type transport system ATP-binding protein